jgi:hypothetical protein
MIANNYTLTREGGGGQKGNATTALQLAPVLLALSFWLCLVNTNHSLSFSVIALALKKRKKKASKSCSAQRLYPYNGWKKMGSCKSYCVGPAHIKLFLKNELEKKKRE